MAIGGARILVVDDEPALRTLLDEILSADGAAVVTAEDGEEALHQALLTSFDLCVLDVEMPRLDGLQTCARLREIPFTKELPVLFLTAHTDKQTIDRAFAAGGSDYLSKPVHPILLRQRVRNLLGLLKLAREAGELAQVLNWPSCGQTKPELAV
jgi:CheY-like chemotaxis protein